MMAKVIVAMSGGVDSAVAAALLLKQGFDVQGLTLRLWHASRDDSAAPEAASQVAAQLGIPWQLLDAREAFRQTVVEAFIASHLANETPNPCVLCNRVLKWAQLLNFADSQHAEFVATGHYARIRRSADGKTELCRAADAAKDQSYMLSDLTQAELSRTLLPLGDLRKPEVRAIAESFNLPVSDRPDSQDICFLDHEDYKQFLREHCPGAVIAGDIHDILGNYLGQHQGLAFYTIGQRKGLPAYTEALYVLEKQPDSNTLIVGTASQLGSARFLVRPVNWISGSPPPMPLHCEVKIRYRATPVSAALTAGEDGSVLVAVDQPLRDVTPGQSAVFYDGEKVLGGGVIRANERVTNEKH
ncbi:MAG: tRNA 2-thiouridine(34) synthase MnmA [Anaerolineaceae bacterium]|jgi:tRNA-specific 2-thiouridylase|nr:tRNA 2-thiouridine(34) synthase MnmA [Anaerolineaceae bacterium]